MRKAYMNNFDYFATFTYADDKHTEEDFKNEKEITKKIVVLTKPIKSLIEKYHLTNGDIEDEFL